MHKFPLKCLGVEFVRRIHAKGSADAIYVD